MDCLSFFFHSHIFCVSGFVIFACLFFISSLRFVFVLFFCVTHGCEFFWVPHTRVYTCASLDHMRFYIRGGLITWDTTTIWKELDGKFHNVRVARDASVRPTLCYGGKCGEDFRVWRWRPRLASAHHGRLACSSSRSENHCIPRNVPRDNFRRGETTLWLDQAITTLSWCYQAVAGWLALLQWIPMPLFCIWKGISLEGIRCIQRRRAGNVTSNTGRHCGVLVFVCRLWAFVCESTTSGGKLKLIKAIPWDSDSYCEKFESFLAVIFQPYESTLK